MADDENNKIQERHPKHILMNELMPEPDEPSTRYGKRLIDWADLGGLGYKPPFPTGAAEERLAKLNRLPEGLDPLTPGLYRETEMVEEAKRHWSRPPDDVA
jgi:hypothetical protein